MSAAGLPAGRRLRRSWPQRAMIGLNLVLIAAALGAALLLHYGYGRAAAINRVALGRSLTALPADVEPGERVLNILLVGSDSSAGLDEDDPIQVGRRGERFGDVIIVAHLDERSGNIALLSFPRDLWVEIADSGRSGRINRAFESGGPATLIETIEDRFDIPIHHYVNVDFAGFQGLVAAIGSVDVFFDTPARDWNVNARPQPRSQTGFLVAEAGCQSLDPEMALAYVRSRYYQTQNADGEWVTDPTSDLGRIRRQQDFLRRVIQQAIEMGARNPFVLRDLIDTGLENVAIDGDLTPQLLVDMGMTYRSFEADRLQTYSFPATDATVGRERVLQPRLDDAEPILALFRGEPFDSPDTVAVTVRVAEAPVTPPALRALRAAGFDVTSTPEPDLGPGVVIHHGPDGRHAAELVAATIGETVVLEQRGDLAGRSLIVDLGPAPEPPPAAPELAAGDAGAGDRGAGGAGDGNGIATGADGGGAAAGSASSAGQMDAIDVEAAESAGSGAEEAAAPCGG